MVIILEIFMFVSPKMDSLIQQGLEYAYVENYPEAESLFNLVVKMDTLNPAGYFFLSGLYNLYSVDMGTDKDFEAFKEVIDKAVKYGSVYIQSHPDDGWGYFFVGGALTYMTFYYGLKGKYWSALVYGIKALKWVQKAVKIDSTIYDAYLGLGGYDYFKGQFPFWRSEKERGIKKIETAIEKGRYSKIAAADGLGQLLMREKRYKEAGNVLEQITILYPASRTLKHPLIETYITLGEWDKAENQALDLLKLSERQPTSDYVRLQAIDYLGTIYYHKKEYKKGGKYLNEAFAIKREKKLSKKEKEVFHEIIQIYKKYLKKEMEEE